MLPLPALSFSLKSWVILNLGDAFSGSIDPDEGPGQLSQAPRKKRGPSQHCDRLSGIKSPTHRSGHFASDSRRKCGQFVYWEDVHYCELMCTVL